MKCRLRKTLVLALCLAGLNSGAARADRLLTFETKPDGSVPVDNEALTVPYPIEGGTVRLFFDMNGNNQFDAGVDQYPMFERIGVDTRRGFTSNFNDSEDTARPGYEGQLGTFFLRETNYGFDSFIAEYDTTQTISEFSGEIWDLDGVASAGLTEQWRVEAMSNSNGVLASLLSPLGTDNLPTNSLDSLPWVFQFRDLPPGVAKIRFTFVGNKPADIIGLGFNNFSPTLAVPEPSSAMLVIVGTGAGLLARRRWHRGAGGRI